MPLFHLTTGQLREVLKTIIAFVLSTALLHFLPKRAINSSLIHFLAQMDILVRAAKGKYIYIYIFNVNIQTMNN